MAISLKSIAKSKPKPPIIVIHGHPGVGKTTFGALAPASIFMPTEDGTGGVSVDAFPLAKSWDEVVEMMTVLLNEKHDYQTVVLDSLSALEILIHNKVAQDNKKASIEDIGYGKGHAFALNYWQQLLDGFALLRDQKNILPLLIAHSDIVRYDSPEVDSFERYVISLHKRAMGLLYERADIIGFASYRTHVTKQDVGFGKQIAKGVGTGERLLHLAEKPAYIAKNRYALPETLPLDWNAFSQALSESFNRANQSAAPQKAAA